MIQLAAVVFASLLFLFAFFVWLAGRIAGLALAIAVAEFGAVAEDAIVAVCVDRTSRACRATVLRTYFIRLKHAYVIARALIGRHVIDAAWFLLLAPITTPPAWDGNFRRDKFMDGNNVKTKRTIVLHGRLIFVEVNCVRPFGIARDIKDQSAYIAWVIINRNLFRIARQAVASIQVEVNGRSAIKSLNWPMRMARILIHGYAKTTRR